MKPEDKILAECHTWLWNNYPELRRCCWHVANERKTSGIAGAVLKAKGVVAGVPDYVINYSGKTYYFEFKTEKGIISKEQKLLHKQLARQGFDVIIVRNFEFFKEYVLQHVFLPES